MHVKGVKGNWVLAKDFWLLWLVFLLLPFSSYAGGLGNAALISMIGFAMPLGRPWGAAKGFVKKIPVAIWALLAFLLWAWISSFWSPYDSRHTLNNAAKIALGVPVYLACAYVIKKISFSVVLSQSLLRILWGAMMVVAVMIIIDQLSGYAVNFALSPPDPNKDINLRLGDTMQNIGHGTSILSLFLPILLAYLYHANPFRNEALLAGPTSRKIVFLGLGIWQIIAILLIFACAIVTGQNSSAVAVVAALCAMGSALKRPKITLAFCALFAFACLAFAPLLGWISGRLSVEVKSKLPFSWEERVDNWAYIYQKINASPWVGHGFDAARTFNETHTIRGFENRAVVSMHPHNAGLHIWVETGLIGILLASMALYFAYRLCVVSFDLKTVHLETNGSGEMGYRLMPLSALCGVMVAATCISSFSYGVWQDWWWASVICALACVFLCQTIATIRKGRPDSLSLA